LSCTGVPKQLVSGSGVVFSGLKFDFRAGLGLPPGLIITFPEDGAGINSVLLIFTGFLISINQVRLVFLSINDSIDMGSVFNSFSGVATGVVNIVLSLHRGCFGVAKHLQFILSPGLALASTVCYL
jgi:hypothetical protein